MQFLFDDDLVEAAIQLCASGKRPGIPPLQLRRFHLERERCYQAPDPDARANAFAHVHSSWFGEWGLDALLASSTGRFPILEAKLTAMAFRQARGRNDEGAELYCDPESRRRGIVALRPGRFAADAPLTRWLHHELAHLADMLDQRFGYTPELGHMGQTISQQRLTRERYRLLWAVSIDGRLIQRGLETVADRVQRQREFDRGFAFLPEARRAELFDELWSGRMARHQQLLEVAADPRGLQGRHSPVPGAACPLCGFATFQWTDVGALRPAASERIRAEFPAWRTGEPLCARCGEMYDAITGLEYPATVCL